MIALLNFLARNAILLLITDPVTIVLLSAGLVGIPLIGRGSTSNELARDYRATDLPGKI